MTNIDRAARRREFALKAGAGPAGVRVVAVFEAAKGALVLLVGFGLLSFIHQDLEQVAEDLVRHLHLDPVSRIPRIFIAAADHLSDVHMWALALLAFAYSALRLTEAYGLWVGRRWAEWLAVASGGIYVPIEVYELFERATPLKWGTFIANVLVVLYMGHAIWHSRRTRLGRPAP